ncbi:MAG TPA: tRNA preQ1(34) S-adenosylmethionine ribosyltransferase-isomerase QueA [Acidimicrobiales bacterium]|jgi:S-adenosylmethionine:tRNA ribosyltransferase-isomerase
MDRFDYGLPPSAIAQVPAEPRSAARLLVDGGPGRPPAHRTVADLPDLVGPGDVLVVNDTRVIPARLALRKATGGEAEVLLLEPHPAGGWEALVRPGRRLPPGTVLRPDAADDGFAAVVGEDLGDGRRRVDLCLPPGLAEADALARHGAVPLPPYLTGGLPDPERYQTVYAAHPGSVAAPTAGLHLTPEVLDRCRERGALVATVDLSVGIGTFRPVTVDDPAEHRMHAERYRVPAATMDACRAARRVVAVGTTTVRALEAAAATGDLEGRTDLFVRRGFPFRVVGALLTNFHLPRSSLLLLVDAFVGDRWRDLYATALADGYRFLSFGDAMFLPARTA